MSVFKNTFISFLSIILMAVVIFACQVDHIEASQRRQLLPEPDKVDRVRSEIHTTLELLSSEITNSDDIESCQSGQKIINSGEKLIPHLMDHFSDSTETKVYSSYNKRCLNRGEIAIILSSEIKQIPIGWVVGIQQCMTPHDNDIEHYFWRIHENFALFIENFIDWLEEEMKE